MREQCWCVFVILFGKLLSSVTNTLKPTVPFNISAKPVRKLSFTGSTRVGKLLLKKGAESVMRMSMELGA